MNIYHIFIIHYYVLQQLNTPLSLQTSNISLIPIKLRTKYLYIWSSTFHINGRKKMTLFKYVGVLAEDGEVIVCISCCYSLYYLPHLCLKFLIYKGQTGYCCTISTTKHPQNRLIWKIELDILLPLLLLNNWLQFLLRFLRARCYAALNEQFLALKVYLYLKWIVH